MSLFAGDSVLNPADEAFNRFKKIRAEGTLPRYDAPDLTESDTRAKLIDPIFKEILGWNEAEIRREEPADPGFADYVFGGDFSYFHVEAKRIQPRFRLNTPSKSRILQLTGPHLLGNTLVRPVLRQAAAYSADLGTEFAVVTNGDQFILFRTRVSGQSWTSGIAMVWHDLEDMADNFAEFYSLLSRDRVRAGALVEAFERASNITVPHHAPIEFVHFPDSELVRNHFWSRISRVFSGLLIDDPTDVVLQEEIIRNCYVTSHLSDEADQSLDRLLQDAPSAALRDAGVKDLKPGMGGATAFDFSVESDVLGGKPATYLLTGGVGSGKTTYLRRFATVVQKTFVDKYCVWLHVDYLPAGQASSNALESAVKDYTYKRLREELFSRYSTLVPNSGDALRAVFEPQIRDAELTTLFKVPRESPKWNTKVNDIVGALFRDDVATVTAILKALRKRGLRTVLVLDNTDQLGEKFQEAVFLLAQRLSAELSALAIVALREERFFAAYRRGIFDAFGDRRFHIGSPNLGKVIRRRLFYGLDKLFKLEAGSALPSMNPQEQDDVSRLIRCFIRSTTQQNQNIVRMLSSISNGDMRHALSMFRAFVSSGNTDVAKILRIMEETGGHYTVPFHEFVKSAVLDTRRYYRGSVSHVANLFQKTSARAASHLTGCRVLARLDAASGAASKHGEGFVSTPQLLNEYRQSFGFAEDFIHKAEELLRRGLIESEPPKASSIESTSALRICAAGAYYWRYLVRAFAYLDLVLVDTPIADRELAKELARLAEQTDLQARFERVTKFLAHVHDQEAKELESATNRAGPYRDSLVARIVEEVANEIELIRKKVGA